MPRSSTLDITTIDDDGPVRVILVGGLDIATVEKFEAVTIRALGAGRSLVVDLGELTVCDSTGLGALVRVHRRAKAGGQELRLGNPRPHVADLLAMTGINKVIPVETA